MQEFCARCLCLSAFLVILRECISSSAHHSSPYSLAFRPLMRLWERSTTALCCSLLWSAAVRFADSRNRSATPLCHFVLPWHREASSSEVLLLPLQWPGAPSFAQFAKSGAFCCCFCSGRSTSSARAQREWFVLLRPVTACPPRPSPPPAPFFPPYLLFFGATSSSYRMSIQMAWFFNLILPPFFENWPARLLAAAPRSGGNRGPQIRVFPKEIRKFQNSIPRKNKKIRVFQWPASPGQFRPASPVEKSQFVRRALYWYYTRLAPFRPIELWPSISFPILGF